MSRPAPAGKGAASGTGPEAASVSSQCVKAGQASSYPWSPFTCLGIPVCVHVPVPVSSGLNTRVTGYMLPHACLHVCMHYLWIRLHEPFHRCLSLQVPLHTHVGLFSHLSFSPCVSLWLYMFLGACVFRDRVRPGPTLTHREEVRLTDSAAPGSLWLCVPACAQTPRSWVSQGEAVLLTDGAAHPETLQGISICQPSWCSPSLWPRLRLRHLRLS